MLFPGRARGFKPHWNTTYAVELYNHSADAGENRNVANLADAGTRKTLSDRLHAGWRAARV